MGSLQNSKPSIRDVKKDTVQGKGEAETRGDFRVQNNSAKNIVSDIVKKESNNKSTSQVPIPKESKKEKTTQHKGFLGSILDDVTLSEINRVEKEHEKTIAHVEINREKKLKDKEKTPSKTGFMGGMLDDVAMSEIERVEKEHQKNITPAVKKSIEKSPPIQTPPAKPSFMGGMLEEIERVENEQKKIVEKEEVPVPQKHIPQIKQLPKKEEIDSVKEGSILERRMNEVSEKTVHDSGVSMTPKTEPEEVEIKKIGWETIRSEYRGHKMQINIARDEFRNNYDKYEQEKENSGLVAKFIDNKSLKHIESMMLKSKSEYNTLLENLRGERQERVAKYVSKIEKITDEASIQHIPEYVALHEMILERHINNELKILERVSSEINKNVESEGTVLHYSDVYEGWLREQPRHRRVKYGVMFGVVLDVGTNSGVPTKFFSSINDIKQKAKIDSVVQKTEQGDEKQTIVFPAPNPIKRQRIRGRRGNSITLPGTDNSYQASDSKIDLVEPNVDIAVGAVKDFMGFEVEDSPEASTPEIAQEVPEVDTDVVQPPKEPAKPEVVENPKKDEIDTTEEEVIHEEVKERKEQSKKVVPYNILKLNEAKARYESKFNTNNTKENDVKDVHKSGVDLNALVPKKVTQEAKPREIQDILNEYLGTSTNEENSDVREKEAEIIEKEFREFLVQNEWAHSEYPGITESEIQEASKILYEDYLKMDPGIIKDFHKQNADWEEVFKSGTYTIYVDKHLIDHVIKGLRNKDTPAPKKTLDTTNTVPAFDEVHSEMGPPDDLPVYEAIHKPLESKSIAEESLDQLRVDEEIPVTIPTAPKPKESDIEITETVAPPTFEDEIHSAEEKIHIQGADYYGEETRDIVEGLFAEQILNSGIRPHVLSSWGPISHAKLQDILDGGGSIKFSIGSNTPITMGKSVEDLCKSVVVQLEKHVDVETFEAYKKENMTLGEFVKKVAQKTNMQPK